ncbi:MAG TPA: hypothetical protein VNL71_09110 [Chloroflexota bacterium]|nr:hypothetical protein [Chloroflexota bacterium]
MAKIIVPKDLLEQLRKEIAEHGTAILADEGDTEEYLVQPAGGFIEPEDDEEMQIVLEALREQDSDEPWLTSKAAREHLHRAREQR